MNKIHFRLVYNRKKKLNKCGKALIQVEIYQNRKKIMNVRKYPISKFDV